jgi:Big-like domain-containing protein
MDKASAEAAFSLRRTSDGAPVSGGFGWYGPRVLIFKPTGDLAPGTQYTASISTAAKDVNGNTLANPVSWSYTTGASG